MDAELHLGQTDAALISFDGDAIAAGQRQLETAAERIAIEQSDGRAGQVLDSLQERLAACGECRRLAGVLETRELVDVGAQDESGGLGRADDDAGQPGLLLEPGNGFLELFDHFGGEGVAAAAGLVDREPGVSGGAEGDAKMPQWRWCRPVHGSGSRDGLAVDAEIADQREMIGVGHGRDAEVVDLDAVAI